MSIILTRRQPTLQRKAVYYSINNGELYICITLVGSLKTAVKSKEEKR